MRILVVSNLYPPHYIGGYEIGCWESVEGLRRLGHEVRVLTSTYRIDRPVTEAHVYRWLQIYVDTQVSWDAVVLKEAINQHAFQYLCTEFQPDVVFVWNLAYASVSQLSLAAGMEIPVCFYIFDNWLANWEDLDDWHKAYKRYGKSRMYGLLNIIPPKSNLRLKNAIFASKYLQAFAGAAGKQVSDGRVIQWGVSSTKFPYNNSRPVKQNRLLYVGQVVRHKGVHTAVQALANLKQNLETEPVRLTIVGDTNYSPEYVSYLKKLADDMEVMDRVTFLGCVRRDQLATIYQSHDILIFPPIWEEPFGLTPLEAMSSGLAVVTTATGGSSEYFEDGVNTLIFPPEDYVNCARQVRRLIEDRKLFKTIRQNGRDLVAQNYRLEDTIRAIEAVLASVSESGKSRRKNEWSQHRYQRLRDSAFLRKTTWQAKCWLRLKRMVDHVM